VIMNEKKISWRRLEGKYAWLGTRGRVTFFTLRFSPQHPDAWDNVGIEYADLPFKLIYHMDSRRVEDLTPMKLAEAQAHAERELDNWLAKAWLTEPEPPTPVQHALNSALDIVEACKEDGITSLTTPGVGQQMAARIALYATLRTLTELAVIKQRTQDTEGHLAAEMEKRREELYEVMTDLKEII
jgi:hypothetical protein